MFVFNIDRGGTFTDFYVQEISKTNTIIKEYSFKVPSNSSKGQGPIVGIKNFLQQKNLMDSEKFLIPQKFIKEINLGTTIATNALLERKGVKNAILLSEGFQDLLQIRHQARPNIFDLKCQFPQPLTSLTYEVGSRIYRNEIEQKKLIKKGQKIYEAQTSEQRLEEIYENLKQNNIESLGISLCNSFVCGDGEKKIVQFMRDKGIKNIEIGSKYASQGYLKRTQTTSLDAYLNPIMKKYFQDIIQNFDHPENVQLKIMKSDGGFTKMDNINASQLLLSGPAGGLIGYARMVDQFQTLSGLSIKNMVGLDMGGTSTDISKVLERQISINYNFEAEGIEICTPHLQIQTIAAGGGSKLGYYNGMLTVGPQSVGSSPGPVCYGIGQQLALTDANLILNRLDTKFFPKVFGKDKKSGLQKDLSVKSFEKLCKEVNEKSDKKQKNIYQLAEGYIEIANELMAKSARKILTMGKPDSLIIFGSAAGQHCCDIGQKIGVQNIMIHKYSGVLSAFGLSKAYETKQQKLYLGLKVQKQKFSYQNLLQLIEQKREKNVEISKDYDEIKREVTIGYQGTSFNLIVKLCQNLIEEFEKKHEEQNGFSLPTKQFRIQYLRQTYIKYPNQFKHIESHPQPQNPQSYLIQKCEVFVEGKFETIPKYDFNEMLNCVIPGPAILLSHTSSIFVKPNWIAKIYKQDIFLWKQKKEVMKEKLEEDKVCDPIKLTLYSTRLMGIAQQMGKVLQKTAISTNIKERLDFSCGIFDWDGLLLANAPHLPVHLGSMETTVLQQIKRGIKAGDVILTNHPQAGGSHLPDLTIITCFEIGEDKHLYVASRGHHADIGGITPGSMPPFSKQLSQEGVAIQKFQIVKDSKFLDKQTRELFAESRRLNDNISDLQAQISANELGIKLLKTLVKEHGLEQFCLYVKYICENACQSVENMLYNFSLTNGFPNIHTIEACQYMDDGTPLKLNLTLNRQTKKAIFDFEGTGPEVKGNTNAPKAITKSAIIYCLRSLIQNQIPLNSGCLRPVQIIVPQKTILNPSKNSAVVGGNVETSMKLCDLILKPFSYVACSQGTMNNFLFGNNKVSYYETICGGSGAGNGFNGRTVQCHMTNTRITDVQHLQGVYPVVLRAFKKNKNSGGEGKFKGGDGVIRQMMFLQEMQVSLLSERRNYEPYGLCGGESGRKGKNWLIKKEKKENLGGKSCFKVEPYDVVRIQTPSGGGYGQK